MKINIVNQSKKLKKEYQEAFLEYKKRLNAFCDIKKITISNIDKIEKKFENTHIIFIKLKDNSKKYESIDSIELANKISELSINGVSEITFVINKENIPSYDRLALSQLDFSEGLTLVMLIEQIYRGFKILNNHTYHK